MLGSWQQQILGYSGEIWRGNFEETLPAPRAGPSWVLHLHWYNVGLALESVAGMIAPNHLVLSGSLKAACYLPLSQGCGMAQRLLEASSASPSYWRRWLWCPKVAQEVVLTFSKQGLLFVLWAQHIVCIDFAALLLQFSLSGLQNTSGRCQHKFGLSNAVGHGLCTRLRCFWNSTHAWSSTKMNQQLRKLGLSTS